MLVSYASENYFINRLRIVMGLETLDEAADRTRVVTREKSQECQKSKTDCSKSCGQPRDE